MATRVIKSGSSSVEFQSAPQPLQIADLDSDLDAIFSNIDNSNVKTGAGIATSKIAQDQGLQTNHYANLSVTQAKLALNAVAYGNIANGAILPSHSFLALKAQSINSVTQTSIFTSPYSFTASGGLLLAIPQTASHIIQGTSPNFTGEQVTWTLVPDWTANVSVVQVFGQVGTPTQTLIWPMQPPPFVLGAAASGVHTLDIKFTLGSTNLTYVATANSGLYTLTEIHL